MTRRVSHDLFSHLNLNFDLELNAVAGSIWIPFIGTFVSWCQFESVY